MKIVILAGKDFSSTVVYNVLKEKHEVQAIIMEEKVSTSVFLKRRIKKLGFMNVAGQVLFQLFVVKYLDLVSKKRKKVILSEKKLSLMPADPSLVIAVNSVNDDETIGHLKRLNPELVVVNGTRIISKKVLEAVNCKFINSHAGITPAYRGVHGAYWALANNDRENAGVTVHFIDSGIDTGAIIYQKKTDITTRDNFVTYPLLQLADSNELLLHAIDDISNDRVVIKYNNLPSRLWSHPTIWGYLYKLVTKKIK